MAAQFGSNVDVKKLNDYLLSRSYISGWQLSSEDVTVYNNLKSAPSANQVNALRWWNHITSHKSNFNNLPKAQVAESDDDDDDDSDLFASDSEAEEEYNRKKAEKIAKKGATVAKSAVIFDIKPWDDDMERFAQIKTMVEGLDIDGLTWGNFKDVEIGYGIHKWQANTVIIDDKVSTDDVIDKIQDFEDHVQSVDIVAFNKLKNITTKSLLP